MLEWILKNKEWVFSGIGVFIVSTVTIKVIGILKF